MLFKILALQKSGELYKTAVAWMTILHSLSECRPPAGLLWGPCSGMAQRGRGERWGLGGEDLTGRVRASFRAPAWAEGTDRIFIHGKFSLLGARSSGPAE